MDTAADERGTAIYLYGVVPAGSPPPSDPPGGVGDAPVRVVPRGGLSAVVSEVPLSEFGHDRFRRNLEDPAWLEARVRSHEAVLAAFHGTGAVVPMRFGTVFRDDARVAEALASRRDELLGDLERFLGRSEWGVKVAVRREDLDRWLERTDEGVGELRRQAASAAEGRAFLLRKRLERASADAADRVLDELLDEAHRRLSDLAEDAVVARPGGALDGGPAEVVFAASYLVRKERAGRFGDAVDDLGRQRAVRGISLRLSGPWAPYSFTSGATRGG
jgi:Gas vesicle synthesis protein GvpL/GvpF